MNLISCPFRASAQINCLASAILLAMTFDTSLSVARHFLGHRVHIGISLRPCFARIFCSAPPLICTTLCSSRSVPSWATRQRQIKSMRKSKKKKTKILSERRQKLTNCTGAKSVESKHTSIHQISGMCLGIFIGMYFVLVLPIKSTNGRSVAVPQLSNWN